MGKLIKIGCLVLIFQWLGHLKAFFDPYLILCNSVYIHQNILKQILPSPAFIK